MGCNVSFDKVRMYKLSPQNRKTVLGGGLVKGVEERRGQDEVYTQPARRV